MHACGLTAVDITACLQCRARDDLSRQQYLAIAWLRLAARRPALDADRVTAAGRAAPALPAFPPASARLQQSFQKHNAHRGGGRGHVVLRLQAARPGSGGVAPGEGSAGRLMHAASRPALLSGLDGGSSPRSRCARCPLLAGRVVESSHAQSLRFCCEGRGRGL